MGRPSLSSSLLSAICQRWMMAKGFPFAVRHSTVVVVELNGPNLACAAGSSSAAARVRAARTVSRKSSSLTTTTSPALPGQTLIVESSTSLPALVTRQSFGAVDVYELPNVWAPAGAIRLRSAESIAGTAIFSRSRLPRAIYGCGTRVIRPPPLLDHDFDARNLGKVQANRAKGLTLARNRHRTAASPPLSH